MKKKKDEKKLNPNRSLIYIIVAAVFLVIVMCVFWISRGTYSLNDDEDRVELICPEETFGPGDEATCMVKLYSPQTTTLSVNANYVFPEGISYVGFADELNCSYEESCFEELAATENGFAVANTTGWTHETVGLVVGKITVKLGDSVESNSTYQIKLTNLELSDSEYEMHELDDVTAEIHTKSSNTEVTNIEVSFSNCRPGQCDDDELPEFNPETLEYNVSAGVDDNRMFFTVTKVDPNATVAANGIPFVNQIDCTGLHYTPENEPTNCGDIHEAKGTVDIHPGTNTINLVVTADDGVATKTYTYVVVKEYKFVPRIYLYDEEHNYIYTSGDSGDTIVSNLGMSTDGVTYSVNNDKLEIRYGEELLKSINIIHFDSDFNYDINNIYLSSLVTRGEFMTHITGEGLTFKMFDGDEEITGDETVIENGSTLKIYYGDEEVETFTIFAATLAFDYDIDVDIPNMILRRLPIGKTVEWLKNKISTSGTITLLDGDEGTILEDDDVLKTCDRLVINIGNDMSTEYKLSVLGDVLGNGQIKINDVGALYQFLKDRRILSLEQQIAGDVVGDDGTIKVNDVGKLYRYVKGTIDSLEG